MATDVLTAPRRPQPPFEAAAEPAPEPLFRGFSCPQEGVDEAVAETAAVGYARRYARLFRDRFGDRLEHQGGGFRDLLDGWLARQASFDEVWALAFGELRKALLAPHENDETDLRRRAAALALRLHEHGAEGAWSLPLEPGTRLRWGRWLLPEGDRIEVAAAGGRATVEVARAGRTRRIELSRTANGWEAQGARLALPRLETGILRCNVLLPEALGAAEFDEVRPLAAASFSPAARDACRAALALVERHTPVYSRWIGRAIQNLLPLTPEPGTIRSGSLADHPGLVHMSMPAQPVALAEMFVHEGAHQHFGIVTRMGPVDDGSDPTLYWSPVRRMNRPIRYILFAYHAFANVLLFYRLCQESGLDDGGYAAKNERDLLPQLGELERALQTTRSLTAVGHSLWRPLAERIR
jgi:HEXXH motif-containing protein